MKNLKWTLTAEWHEKQGALSPKLYKFADFSHTEKHTRRSDATAEVNLIADAAELGLLVAVAALAARRDRT